MVLAETAASDPSPQLASQQNRGSRASKSAATAAERTEAEPRSETASLSTDLAAARNRARPLLPAEAPLRMNRLLLVLR
jgi:hypothetical protein